MAYFESISLNITDPNQRSFDSKESFLFRSRDENEIALQYNNSYPVNHVGLWLSLNPQNAKSSFCQEFYRAKRAYIAVIA